MMAGGPEQSVRVLFTFEECCSVHEAFGRVPNQVTDGFLRVNAEQVLQDVQERDLLGRVHHRLVDGVEDV